jgi:flavin reductase (DIM6/NTAB) family NADH-FMN oxidoreductase RutF
MTAFDELVAQLDPAMVIVTTSDGVERGGCLVGFHAQSSIEPERYVVWLSKANHTYRVALHGEHVAVHFLDESDLDLATLFGTTSGDEIDKFGQCAWEPGPDGVPLLAACGNRFVARRSALLDEGGDHVCLVVEPTESWSTGTLRPLRLSVAKRLDPGHESDERPRPGSLTAG